MIKNKKLINVIFNNICYILLNKNMKEISKEKEIEKERIKTIDIILDMYPELKKDKDEILINVLEKYGKPIKYILTRFEHNNQIYYIDPEGMIVDKNLNFKGLKYDNTFYFEDSNYKKFNLEYHDRIMNYNLQK